MTGMLKNSLILMKFTETEQYVTRFEILPVGKIIEAFHHRRETVRKNRTFTCNFRAK